MLDYLTVLDTDLCLTKYLICYDHREHKITKNPVPVQTVDLSHISHLRNFRSEVIDVLCLAGDTLMTSESLNLLEDGSRLPFDEGRVIFADEGVIVCANGSTLQAMRNPGSKLLLAGDYRMRNGVKSAHQISKDLLLLQYSDYWAMMSSQGQEKEWKDPFLKAVLQSHHWSKVYSCPGRAKDSLRMTLIKMPAENDQKSKTSTPSPAKRKFPSECLTVIFNFYS